MKKIILLFVVALLSTFAFVACQKEQSATQFSEVINSPELINDTELPQASFANETITANKAVAAGKFLLTMPITQVGTKCIPCKKSWSCLCEDQRRCQFTDVAQFAKIRREEPDMSLSSLSMLSKDQVELSTITPDNETLEKMNVLLKEVKGNQTFLLEHDIAFRDDIAKTLSLRQGAFMKAGKYAVTRTKEQPYGKVILNIGYNK